MRAVRGPRHRVNRRLRDYLTSLTEDVWQLERQVTAGHLGNAEQFFRGAVRIAARPLAIRTMAASSGEVYGRMVRLSVFGPAGAAQLVGSRTSSAGLTRWPSANASTYRA